ncbi:MAG: ribosome-associated translation inhibitor RaiA [Pyrinomonadaceae bacterium]
MKFEFTGRHIDVTPALRRHVEDHFAKIEHLFDGRPPKVHVIIEVERGMHHSEIVINWRNEVLTADTSVSDMYQSLSQTIGKIEKQARRLKDKVIDKSHKATKASVLTAATDVAEKVAMPPRIIETDGVGHKPMTEEEAAMELDSTDRQFLMFRNATGGKLAVIFKRDDGNYGLVQG